MSIPVMIKSIRITIKLDIRIVSQSVISDIFVN
jgi:hypothetical protein